MKDNKNNRFIPLNIDKQNKIIDIYIIKIINFSSKI